MTKRFASCAAELQKFHGMAPPKGDIAIEPVLDSSEWTVEEKGETNSADRIYCLFDLILGHLVSNIRLALCDVKQ
jgi:hypothetical protein